MVDIVCNRVQGFVSEDACKSRSRIGGFVASTECKIQSSIGHLFAWNTVVSAKYTWVGAMPSLDFGSKTVRRRSNVTPDDPDLRETDGFPARKTFAVEKSRALETRPRPARKRLAVKH